jgi:hypothetical protein
MPEDTMPEVVTREELNQRKARQAAREAVTTDVGRALPIDECQPGGRFLVGGVLVDAEGKPLKDEKDKTP